MTRSVWPCLVLALLTAMQAGTAEAYIGPGMGAGALAAALGVLGSIFLAIVAVVYYPIKRMLKGRKAKAASGADKPTK